MIMMEVVMVATKMIMMMVMVATKMIMMMVMVATKMIMAVMSELEWAHHFWQPSPSHLNTILPFRFAVQCNLMHSDAQCLKEEAVQSFLSGLQQPLAPGAPRSHKSVALDTSLPLQITNIRQIYIFQYLDEYISKPRLFLS